MRFAIYIRRGEETFDAIGEVPDQLRKRTLAVRGFDASGMMTGWEIVEGTNAEAAIERQFANAETEYLHIHFAAPGCYAARVDRVAEADSRRCAAKDVHCRQWRSANAAGQPQCGMPSNCRIELRSLIQGC